MPVVDVREGPGSKVLVFDCPGCLQRHCIPVEAPDGPTWSWSGSVDFPTLSPSVLVDSDYTDLRCHFFVSGGVIRFLSDCNHPLAGHSVPMQEWNDD